MQLDGMAEFISWPDHYIV